VTCQSSEKFKINVRLLVAFVSLTINLMIRKTELNFLVWGSDWILETFAYNFE
jgi:hypothetical protein